MTKVADWSKHQLPLQARRVKGILCGSCDLTAARRCKRILSYLLHGLLPWLRQ